MLPVSSVSSSSRASFAGLGLLPLDTRPALAPKSQLLKFAHLLSYQSGLSTLYARLKRESVATILMYHSVPAPHEVPWIDPRNCLLPDKFEQQMRFLARARRVISIEQLTSQLERGEPIARGTVAITFDDGYLNNLTMAAPILAEYDLPATVYLATNYISAGENQWIDMLYSAFRARSRHRLVISDAAIQAATRADIKATVRSDIQLDTFQGSAPRARSRTWDLNNSVERRAAYRAISQLLIGATVAQRQYLLEAIDDQLAPIAYPPRLTMTWDDVRQLQQYPQISLGVHTANHLDLSTHSDRAAEEMTSSIAQMVTATGDRPEHLAFPYNRYNAQAQAQAMAARLRSAAGVSEDPVVRANTSPYALPRLEAPQSMTLLKSWTNGGFPDISRRLFGRVWRQPY